MYIRFFVALTVFLFFSSLNSASAQKEISTQFNSWYMYFGNHRLNNRWGIHTEYQWRREGIGETWQQSLLRVGADYHANDKNTLTAGYAWVVTYPYGDQPVAATFTEHRIWQQWITQHQSGPLYVHHRYRLEQRFLEQPAEDKYVFRQRFRYRLLLTLPIGRKELADAMRKLGAEMPCFECSGDGRIEFNATAGPLGSPVGNFPGTLHECDRESGAAHGAFGAFLSELSFTDQIL